jgi:hypothetical protein
VTRLRHVTLLHHVPVGREFEGAAADLAPGLLHALVALLVAGVAPRLEALLSLPAVVAEVGLVGLATQLTQLVDLLVVSDFLLLRVSYKLEVRVEGAREAGVNKAQRFAMLVAVVTIEKHRDACFS